jgi:hypothetical protein
VLTSTGTGGLDELRDALDDSRASYAYARVQYANDKESQREKFVLVVWIGPGCKVMRKAKVTASAPRTPARSRLTAEPDLGARGGREAGAPRLLDRGPRAREGRPQGGADCRPPTQGASPPRKICPSAYNLHAQAGGASYDGV